VDAETRFLSSPFRDCPVKVAVRVLGKKWTLRILGHVAVFGHDRFNELRTALPGIAPKVLARELRDLQESGLLTRVVSGTNPKRVRWQLTERGGEAVPILLLMAGFASKYYPDRLFEDREPRSLGEILDDEGKLLMRNLL
jgi:DNA-binding HxlR family transcriptional regulator